MFVTDRSQLVRKQRVAQLLVVGQRAGLYHRDLSPVMMPRAHPVSLVLPAARGRERMWSLNLLQSLREPRRTENLNLGNILLLVIISPEAGSKLNLYIVFVHLCLLPL